MGFAGKFNSSDLQNLGLNQTKDAGSGCVAPNSGSQPGSGRAVAEEHGFGYPNNGEFDFYLGNTPCSRCLFTNGDDSCTGALAPAGVRPAVKRIAYKGDPTECCQTGNLLDSNSNTCDPKYQNADNCTTALTNFCNNTDNISSSKCAGFIQKHGKDQFLDTINSYCKIKDNVKGTFCQTMKNAETDQIVTDYCKANKDDTSFCGCYNLGSDYVSIINQLAAKGQTLTPWCSLKTCATNSIAYKPYSWDGTCPSMNVCLQSINVGSAQNADFKNINFICDNTSTSNTNTVTPSSFNLASNSKYLLLIPVFLFLIILIVIIST